MEEELEEIVELLKDYPRGLTNKQVAEELDIGETTASKRLDLCEAYKMIDREKCGKLIKNYSKNGK